MIQMANPQMVLLLGPHLHLGIRIEGNYVNPLDYF